MSEPLGICDRISLWFAEENNPKMGRSKEHVPDLLMDAQHEIEQLRHVLYKIRDSGFCQYERNGSGLYGIGVTDGHRLCARWAAEVLDGETRGQ